MATVQQRSAQAKRRTPVDDALAACRSAFLTVGLFSFAINILILASPLYMLQVYDRVLTTGHYETLALLTLMAGVALFILGTLEVLRSALLARVGRWLNARLGPDLLAISLRTRLMGDPSGAQPLRDLGQIQSFLGGQGLGVFFDSPWMPVFLVLIWFLHPMLGIVALLAALALFVMSLLNELMTRKPIGQANQAQIAATLQAEATIRNAEVVRAMGMQPAMVGRWASINETALDAMQQANERGGLLVGYTKFLRFFVQMAILGVGALLVLKGELSSGGMVAASILLGRALAPVEQAMGAWRTFTGARLAYARLQQRLAGLPAEPERTQLPDPVGRLSVEGVTYAPAGGDRPVLRQVGFALEPGEACAVVGPSAAGKSSLCRVLVGIAPPAQGCVRLDGAELGHWDPLLLGRFIGYLPQDVELFAGTVRENIARMGEGPDGAVVEAARLAHAHEMILRLPQGYETQIGDGGTRLSAGQRQRLGLARAIYGQPKLVVLDEPNANLDQAGEEALAAAFAELKAAGATLVVMSHRQALLRHVDRILVMKDGKVEAFGPRDAIMQQLRPQAAQPVPLKPVPMQATGTGMVPKPAAVAVRPPGPVVRLATGD